MPGQQRDELREAIDTIAKDHGVDLVGVAPLSSVQLAFPPRPAEDLLPGARTVVALAAGLMWGPLNSPGGTRGAVKDAQLAYDRVEQSGAAMGRYLESRGFACYLPPASMPVDTLRHKGKRRMAAQWSHRQAAIAAGLGVRGLNNLLVTPEFGPYVRLGSLLTTAEIDPAERTLPDNLCHTCRKCVEVCPAGALTQGGDGAVRLDQRTCLTQYIRPFLLPRAWQTIRSLLSPAVLGLGVQVLLEGYHFSCAECQRVCPRGSLRARQVAQRRLRD